MRYSGRGRRSRPGIPSRRAQVTTDALRHDLSVVGVIAPIWARTDSVGLPGAHGLGSEILRAQVAP